MILHRIIINLVSAVQIHANSIGALLLGARLNVFEQILKINGGFGLCQATGILTLTKMINFYRFNKLLLRFKQNSVLLKLINFLIKMKYPILSF